MGPLWNILQLWGRPPPSERLLGAKQPLRDADGDLHDPQRHYCFSSELANNSESGDLTCHFEVTSGRRKRQQALAVKVLVRILRDT